MLRKLSCMTAMMLMLSHGVAMAQDSVKARIAPHGGSARVVFNWPSAVTYTASRNGDKLEITFARPGTLDTPAGSDPGITGVQQVAGGNDPLKVILSAAPGREFRHFAAGNRIIVDVIDKNAPQQKVQATPPAVEKPQAPPEEKKSAAKTDTPAPVKTPEKADVPPMPAKVVAAVKEENIPEGKVAPEPAHQGPDLAPHTISVTTTENVGIAAFERFGTLWIVVDRPGFTIPPQITGPDKDKFPAFQRADLADATTFRMPLPEGAEHVYGEGGGLVWRVVVTPKQRYTTPVLPERLFDNAKEGERGGTVKWPLRRVTKMVTLTDPSVGDTITVATVSDSAQNTGDQREFVDFTTLDSPIGLAIHAKVDDLKIEKLPDGIQITRPGGLALSRVKDVKAQKIREEIQDVAEPVVAAGDMKRLFDFDRWLMGGVESLSDNQHILLAGMGHKDKNGKVQDLLALAKMNIANDRGQEALGFLNFAAQELPQIAESPEFRALRGAAEALAGKYELAWRDLNDPILADYDELDYWRAYTLAWLEDWQQAGETMPKDHKVLLGYPRPLLEKMGIKLAELSLRKNEVPRAEEILAKLERSRATLKPWTVAALDYLTGQAARQKGEVEKTRPLWEPLIHGKDDFYRARAGLALTMLELESKNINLEQAIDRLEGLRYAWRGDELESQINYMLGKLYIEHKEYLKGFTILREATDLSKGSDISGEIQGYMGDAFMNLLLNSQELSAEDAVMVYEEFKDLTPDTAEGNKLVQKLAERMVDADLLTRAGAILQHQVDFKVAGADQARVAMRLAAIYLLDHDPKPAIAALDKAKAYYATQTDEASKAELRASDMMRARALSQLNQTEEAIALLNGFPPAPDVNRLRADISWQSGLWEDAAEALQDLILDQAIDGQQPLTDDQADLILNRAVALNLSSNRIALTNMQKRYGEAMQKTPRARLFDIVSRPRKTSVMADRQTIEQIVSEVDLFKGFLEAYKATGDAKTN